MKKGDKRGRLYDWTHRRKFRDKVDAVKAAQGCCVCGESDPACLDFHHKDPGQKEFCIGKGTQMNWSRVLKEIEKCSIICANCHRKVTRNEWGTKND